MKQMIAKRILSALMIGLVNLTAMAQPDAYDVFFKNSLKSYQSYGNQSEQTYLSFRDKANKDYIDFLKHAWGNYDKLAPVTRPIERNTVPPKPYENPLEDSTVEIVPENVPDVKSKPQPSPIEPIQERPVIGKDICHFAFYGICEIVRIPIDADIKLKSCDIDDIAEAWEKLCNPSIDNTIIDCLNLREKYNLCDWAYLMLLDAFSHNFLEDSNGATLLMAFLYCQSGYQMRLAIDKDKLFMLFGSRHQIYEKGYFSLDGISFYPYGEPSDAISICNASFEGETPLSLIISDEQWLGGELSDLRHIKSEQYGEVDIESRVPIELVKFYDKYPTSALDGNPMTRWAMYANTPLAQKTKDVVYPKLKEAIKGCSVAVAANKILNWVQTGFVYEYDDKVWGHDRAFFAEESLYYPYCDCEDRSILFSRLVRDLLGLDVALVYYPGHLATAVCFDDEVRGDAMVIDGRKFIVCDPTYIGAPVGAQMPDLEYDKAQAIVLRK